MRTAFHTNARLEFSRTKHIVIYERAEKISNLLVALFNLNARVLVHCLEGIDRTPFIVMLYVARKYNLSYKAAYQLVKQRRPQTHYYWKWLQKYEEFLADTKHLNLATD